jgi:phosphate transport system substrate-binding protein
MASRALKPEETLIAHTIARDGVGIIVHKSNSVVTLTETQLVSIFTGAISSWSGVGGKDHSITVVNKAEGRSTLELFCQHFSLTNPQIKAQVVIGDNEQGIKTVSGNPHAIGYVSIGTAQVSIEANVPIRLLPMAGIAATTEAVRNGTWPLARPLNLVTKGNPSGLVADFITFAMSKEVDDLITDLAFVPPTR